jgi:dienelactone hydrolase
MRTLLAAAVLVVLTSFARAEIVTKDIPYEHNGVKLKGYLAYDDAKATPGSKAPGVLVVHEWWGLNDYPKQRARQLAELGYVAFALDMYGDGVVATDSKKAQELASPFYSDARLVRDRAVMGLKQLLGQPNVDGDKIAAIGYCFGGTTVLELARSGAPLVAVVSFHGGLKTQKPAEKGQVKARVLVCNGAEDPMTKNADREAFMKEMEDAGVDYAFINYAGAVHGFTNPKADSLGVPGVAYNQKADERSWRLMQDWLREAFGMAGKAEGGKPAETPGEGSRRR